MTVQKSAQEPVIVVDTREQKPYRFTRCQVKTLTTGDYSLVGLEDRVAIERKSAADLAGSLGSGRARFQRELERLAQLDYAAIVVEASLRQLLQPLLFSRMHPKAVVNSMLAWSVQYRMPVFFAGDRGARSDLPVAHQILALSPKRGSGSIRCTHLSSCPLIMRILLRSEIT